MTTQVNLYQCPACTGTLRFSAATGKLECEYCGSAYTTEEVEAIFGAKDAAAADAHAAAEAKRAAEPQTDESEWDTSGFTGDWGEAANGMRVFSCPSCGAELICESTTAATSCPYCANPVVLASQFSGGLRPELIIPFKYDKDQAMQALYKHYRHKRLLPGIFKDKNRIKEVKGVYVPFWMFDAKVSAATYYKAEKDTIQTVGDERYVVTSYYSVTVSGNASFKNIPIDSSTKIDNILTESIEPYKVSEAVKFDMAYLSGFFADKYDVDKNASTKRIKQRLFESMYDRMTDKLLSFKDYEKLKREYFTIDKLSAKYLLCPVWILTTEWEGKLFTFVMNGQTGKIAGDLPMSKRALAKYLVLAFLCTAGITFAVAMFIFYLLGGF